METGEHTQMSAGAGVAADKLAIFVLGMHRSGTSALAGLLGALGVTMPQMLMASHPTNPKGFFESYAIMDVSEHMLAAAGSSWDDWRAVDFSRIAGIYEEPVADVLHNEFGDASPICIKDPRHCRLAPIWLPVAQHIGYRIAVLLPFRHPMEVARSLHLRDGLPISQALLIWLRHALDAEYHSRDFPRAFVYLPDLLDDWQGTVDRIGSGLHVTWPTSPEDAAPAVAEFLDRDLKNHNLAEEVLSEDPMLGGWVRLTFDAYKALAVDPVAPDAMAVLGGLRNDLDQAGALFGPTLSELEVHNRTLDGKRVALTAQVEQMQAELARVRLEADNRTVENRILVDRLATETAQIQSLREKANRVDGLTHEAGVLRARVSTLDTDVANFHAGLVAAETHRKALDVERVALRDELAKREADLAAVVEARNQLAEDLEKAERAHDETTRLKDGQLEAVRTELQAADERLKACRADLATVVEARSQLVENLEKAERAYDETTRLKDGQLEAVRAELQAANERLKAYRDAGIVQSLKWAFSKSRP